MQIVARQVELAADGLQVASYNLCRSIDHAIGVFVYLYKSFDSFVVLYDVGNDGLASEEQFLVMFVKLGDVNILELGQEQRFNTIAGLYQAEPGIAMGEAEGLLDGNGKQW